MRVRVDPVWTAAEPPVLLAPRVLAPMAIVHGYRDHMIPYRAALDLHTGGEEQRRLFLVPTMGHAFDPAGHTTICEAVDWVLQRAEGGADR
jgi:fermentation-respiration switch protein FrsA (DUF1100 family)